MQCPRCKGNNVTVRREFAGSTYKTRYKRTGVKSSWFLPAGIKEGKRENNYRTLALCNDCGNTWTVLSQAEKATGVVFIAIIVLVIGAIIFSGKKDDDRKETIEKNSDPTIITTDENIDTSIWSSEYTSIEDFAWSLDENGITLGDYNAIGDDMKIRLSDKYTINGKEYHVTKLDGCFFCDHVKSVIVSEGVTEIVHHTFNSCGVKYLYLPSSLETFDGWNYFGDLKELYYGGTEEQFNERFNAKDYLKNTTIHYDSNPNELK